MTHDGGGWTRMMSAQYAFFFNGDNRFDLAAGDPLAASYSILKARTHLAQDGCYTFRLQVGSIGDWQNVEELEHFTVWQQCHDAFTVTTNGNDYTFQAGEESATCGGFNGLHDKYTDYSFTCDPDSNDNTGCWWMQVVPNKDYDGKGYLEGYGGSGNYHNWQSLWIR